MAILDSTTKSVLNGTKTPTATTSDMKTALGKVYDFVTDLLGTDSSNKAAARLKLGVVERAGLRNVIINGDFRINQRGYTSGQSTTGANQYTLDRWRITSSAQAISWVASGNGKLLTVPAGGIEQIVEGAVIDGGTYMIGWTGTATCTINGASVANGATVTLAAATNVSVKFFGGTLSQVLLCPGAAGAWEQRPLELETMLCLRYYEKPSEAVWYPAIQNVPIVVPFQVEKRSPVTVSFTAANALTFTLDTPTTTHFAITCTSATQTAGFYWSADAELTA